MTDIIEKLFNHAAEKNFHPYMSVQAYYHYLHEMERTETSLRQQLPPDQAKILEELRQNWMNCSSITQEAAFQSGLAIGLELSRQ